MLCYKPPYQMSVHCCLGYTLGHTATGAWIRTPTVRTAEVMNSRNSSSIHSMIQRSCVDITADTTSTYSDTNEKEAKR